VPGDVPPLRLLRLLAQQSSRVLACGIYEVEPVLAPLLLPTRIAAADAAE
jgi:hypothetical protein